jgi:hypothetical protein
LTYKSEHELQPAGLGVCCSTDPRRHGQTGGGGYAGQYGEAVWPGSGGRRHTNVLLTKRQANLLHVLRRVAKFETKDRGTVGDLGHLIENGRQSNVRAPQPGADGEQERKTIKSGISKFKMRTSIVILAVALPTH